MRINEYPETMTPSSNDKFILDGENGTKSVKMSTMAKKFGNISDSVIESVNHGSTNLLKNTRSGSITIDGIIFTINEDGSINVNGTASNNGRFDINTELSTLKAGISYITSISKNDTGIDLVVECDEEMQVRTRTSQSFECVNADEIQIYLEFYKDTTYDCTLYPMIRLSVIEDDTYYPYAPSNFELSGGTGSAKSNEILTYDLSEYTASIRRVPDGDKYKLCLVFKDNLSDSEKVFHTLMDSDGTFIPEIQDKVSRGGVKSAIGSESVPVYVNQNGEAIPCNSTGIYTTNGQGVFTQAGAYNLYQQLFYKAGDTITLNNACFAAHTGNSGTDIEFFIPLSKPVLASSATISPNSNIIFRHGGHFIHTVNSSSQRGDVEATGTTLFKNYGTPLVAIKDNGLFVRLTRTKNKLTDYNNVVIDAAVRKNYNMTITFN